jgi:hypothetical protein
VGERFTDQLSQGEFPAVVRNSTAAAPSISLGHCVTGDAEAVLTVKPGKTKSVLASLLRQNTSKDVLRDPMSTTFNGATITRISYAYYTTIIVVEGRGQAKPFLTIEWCND